jgi:heme exporter protein CcmD
MDHNWGYVVAGYGVTAAALVSYVVWLAQRTRRVRRSLSDERSD